MTKIKRRAALIEAADARNSAKAERVAVHVIPDPRGDLKAVFPVMSQ